jgi:hypothetical protein
MSSWGNSDNHNQKPKWVVERETREVFQFTITSGNTAGNNMITVAYNDGGQNNVANIGVQAGQFVYFWYNGNMASGTGGQSGNGIPGMFASNTTVGSVSGNTITLGQNLFGAANAGWVMEIDKAIVYNTNKTSEVSYNQDTVMVTPTRMANATFNSGNMVPGWTNIRKKVNNDGTVRYMKETLVAMASPTAANTNSGNTSWGQAFTGI